MQESGKTKTNSNTNTNFESCMDRVKFVHTIRTKLKSLGFFQPYDREPLILLDNLLVQFVKTGETIVKTIPFQEAKRNIQVNLSPYKSIESFVLLTPMNKIK